MNNPQYYNLLTQSLLDQQNRNMANAVANNYQTSLFQNEVFQALANSGMSLADIEAAVQGAGQMPNSLYASASVPNLLAASIPSAYANQQVYAPHETPAAVKRKLQSLGLSYA